MFFEELLADELFVSKLTQVKVKYFVFPTIFSQNLQKLGSIYSPASFTVRHQGRLLEAPDAPSPTALAMAPVTRSVVLFQIFQLRNGGASSAVCLAKWIFYGLLDREKANRFKRWI